MMTPLVLAATVGATWTLSVQRTEAAASCPDEPRLRRAIAERLGKDPFLDAVPPSDVDATQELANPFDGTKPPVDEHRTVSVQFSREPSRHLAVVALVDRSGRKTGTRELSSTASDCGELAGAVVLAATIVIDPLVLTRPAPVVVDAGVRDEWSLPPLSRPPDAMRPPPVQPRTDPPPPVELPPLPRPPPELQPAKPFAPREPPKPLDALFFGLGGGVSVGQVPQLAALATAQVSWGTRNTLLSLSADLTSPGARTVGVGSVSALLFAGTLDGCAKWGWFGGCAVVSLGTLETWSSNLPNPRPRGTLFPSAGLGALLDIPAGELLRVRLDAKGWYQANVVVVDVGGVPVWANGRFAFTATASVHFKVWGDVLP